MQSELYIYKREEEKAHGYPVVTPVTSNKKIEENYDLILFLETDTKMNYAFGYLFVLCYMNILLANRPLISGNIQSLF